MERLRTEKEQAKQSQKVKKMEKQAKAEEPSDKEESKEKDGPELDEIPEKEALHLRKFLKDGTEFRGLEKTVIALMKDALDGRKNKDGRIKVKEAAKSISKVFPHKVVLLRFLGFGRDWRKIAILLILSLGHLTGSVTKFKL